jgi:integrase
MRTQRVRKNGACKGQKMPKVRLTDRFVAGAKAASRLDYFDETTQGLSLRVSASQKSWTFNFTSPKDGKRARLGLGVYPGTTLAQARTRAIEARQLLDELVDPRDVLAERAAGAMTVSTLVDSYLERHVRPNWRRPDEVERRLRKNVVDVVGNVKLADLHRRDINRAVDRVRDRGSPVEAARVFGDMRTMLRWAMARGDMDRNPIDGMPKPAEPAPRERVLTDDEIKTLWLVLPRALERSPSAQRIIRLCLLTAQRIGEISGMRPDELNRTSRTWMLQGLRTKNGHSHRVPLAAVAIEIIKDALEAAGEGARFVFPNEAVDGPLDAKAVTKTILRASIADEGRPNGRLGLAPWTPHDLRRTATTGMAQLGVAPIVLGHVINHRSVTKAGVTLSVYSQYDYAKEKRAALELWADRVAGIVGAGAGKVLTLKPRSTA